MSWFTSIRDSVEKVGVTAVAVGTLGHVNLTPLAAKSVFVAPSQPTIAPAQTTVQTTAAPYVPAATYTGGNAANIPQPAQVATTPQSPLNSLYLMAGFFLIVLLILFKR